MKRSKKLWITFLFMLIGSLFISIDLFLVYKNIFDINILYKIILGIGSFTYVIGIIYFIISELCKNSVIGNINKLMLYLFLCIIFSILLYFGLLYFTNHYIIKTPDETVPEINNKYINSSSEKLK